MKIIKEKSENISKVLGIGKVDPDAEYRLIKYHLMKEIPEGVLLANCITGELIFLDNSEKNVALSSPSSYKEAMKDLVERHFLVPKDYDEHKAVLQLRKLLNLFFIRKEITGYTILPTTCCNARCFYCYESDVKHVSMTEETAEKVLQFIGKNSNGKKVRICWFGGEPTLGMKRIDQISDGLIDAGIEFSASMITNGYLFDGVSAKKAKEDWHVTNVQITLDGTEKIYNSVKSYVGAVKSPFRRVIRNIGLLLENGIRVSVRMNLDRYNGDDLKKLIGFLGDEFSGKGQFSVYVSPLFDDCGFDPVKHDHNDRKWLSEKQAELNDVAREKGIFSEQDLRIPKLLPNHCMADSDSSVIIGADGGLAKCDHYIETLFGSVFSDGVDKGEIERWRETVEYPECAECAVFPTCVELKNCFSSENCIPEKRSEKKKDFYRQMEIEFRKADLNK